MITTKLENLSTNEALQQRVILSCSMSEKCLWFVDIVWYPYPARPAETHDERNGQVWRRIETPAAMYDDDDDDNGMVDVLASWSLERKTPVVKECWGGNQKCSQK